MPRSRHERVVFRSSFSDARFGSFRSKRDRIFGDDLQQLIEETFLLSGPGIRGIECFCPLAEGVDGTLETETCEVGLVECCRLLHETAHKVVGDDMKSDFLAHHLGGATSQNIHTKRDLNIAEEQLDAPAAEIQFGQFFGRIGDGIRQCGDDDNGLGPEPGNIDLDVQHSQRKRLGKRLPFSLGKLLGARCRPGPCDETLSRPQALALAEVSGAGVVNAHHSIDPLGQQFGDGAVRTKSAIGERNVAFFEKIVLLSEEAALVDMLVTFLQAQQRPAGEAKEPHQFGNGKSAPVGLIGMLGPYGLVFRRVGHGDACTVDDFDVAAQPQLLGDDSPLQLFGRVGLDIVKLLKRETRARLTISTRVCAGDRESLCRVPCLDLADDFAAWAAGGQDLGQECPEGDRHRVRSSSTIGPMCGRLQMSDGRPWLTDAGQLTERALTQAGDPGPDLLLCGSLSTTEENTMETGEERG